MKQKKTMVILILILAVLASIYGGLKAWGKKAAEKEAGAAAEKITVTDLKNLSSFSYSNGQETMSFVKEDGTWKLEDDKEIRLNQSTVESIGEAAASLAAVRELKEPDDLDDYGLTKPSYTIDLTTEDGDKETLYVGDAAGEDYYAMTEGTQKVYTISISLVSALQFDLSGLAQLDVVPAISSGSLKKVKITENGETTTYKEEDELAELAGGFGALTLTECADYHVTDEELSAYGLDEASRVTAEAAYKDAQSGKKKTFTVYIGKMSEDGASRYVMVKDSKMAYKVSQDVVSNMITVSQEDAKE